MTWYIENGQAVEGALSACFKREDLSAGMKVQILKGSSERKLKQATITRVHGVSADWQRVGFKNEHGKQWTQARGFDNRLGTFTATHYMWTLTDDDEALTDDCAHGHGHAQPCVHVRYRNGVKAVVDNLCYVRPPESAIEQLAQIADDA